MRARIHSAIQNQCHSIIRLVFLPQFTGLQLCFLQMLKLVLHARSTAKRGVP